MQNLRSGHGIEITMIESSKSKTQYRVMAETIISTYDQGSLVGFLNRFFPHSMDSRRQFLGVQARTGIYGAFNEGRRVLLQPPRKR
jgi:hypothetical protein